MTQRRRRLTDLYIVGTEVVFDDGQGDPITVFLRKLGPVEHETALKRANAARSRMAAVKRQPDSDDYLAHYAAVTEFSEEELASYLLEEHRASRAPIVEAELASEGEWAKDGYLDGLHEAWLDGGMKEAYAKDPEDPEAKRVFDELGRFADKVDAEVAAEVEAKRADLEHMDLEKLQQAVFEKYMEVQASLAWLTEYRRCEIWLATRDPKDKKTRYFESRDEVNDLPIEVSQRLMDAYRDISVEPMEGKDSLATDTSSPSSEQQENPVTGEDSGQSVASQ
jgi:hypothetical protein